MKHLRYILSTAMLTLSTKQEILIESSMAAKNYVDLKNKHNILSILPLQETYLQS